MAKRPYERPVIIKQQSGFMNKFGSAPVSMPKTAIDDVPVADLVRDYGSPLFVISERTIRENQRTAMRVFRTRYPRVQFAWSYKTNYLNAVCSVFHQEGSWAEVVSEFEYDRARALGVPGAHILFNGPDKGPGAIEKAIRDRAKLHIDHTDELYDIIEATERLGMTAEVAIRVNMDVGVYPKWDRFGFNYENGEAQDVLKRILMASRLKLVGLHCHIGTYIMSAEPYRIALGKLVALANWLASDHGVNLQYIDAGGGLPSHNTLKGQYLPAEEVLPSLEHYADAITAPLLELHARADARPMLILESGRALIDSAGYLISTVRGNKRLSDGKRALIIDAGVNILFTSFWYKHTMLPAQVGGVMKENAAVFGPLCMNIDCIREEISVPVLKKGERVVILNVGAYNMTQWMQFISLRPAVVMVMETGKVELVRTKEDLAYVMSPERIPPSLATLTLS
jgi:diaminopimelate decarboxylase